MGPTGFGDARTGLQDEVLTELTRILAVENGISILQGSALSLLQNMVGRFHQSQFMELNVINTAFNFYPPIANQQFVITGLTAKAGQAVSTSTNAIVIVYESNSASSTTPTKLLFETGMVRNDQFDLLPLKMLITEGKFINAKTTDDVIFMNIMGYYIPNI